MLRWALAFFVLSIVAAALGFTGLASAAAGVARMLFFLFLLIFALLLVIGLAAGQVQF